VTKPDSLLEVEDMNEQNIKIVEGKVKALEAQVLELKERVQALENERLALMFELLLEQEDHKMGTH
jgi:hypothetical protein